MKLIYRYIPEKKVVLEMRRWRLYLSDEAIKQLMVDALNKSIVETAMPLRGYFITNWRIYLVMDVLEIEETDFILHFLNQVHKRLVKYAVNHHELDVYFEEKEVYKNVRNLFRYYDYFDVSLCDLLTGRIPDNAEIDPDIQHMEEFLKYYDYSSYRNYAGEKGPVIFSAGRMMF